MRHNRTVADVYHHIWNVAAGKSPWRAILGLSRHGCRYKPTARHGVYDDTHPSQQKNNKGGNGDNL
ncbi:hypothetical protein [Petroclostridium xylanilyticum]|uniref:hypothetical protein n=1 Tax=Petroclostridium xylanilyticum TaxID=1792311 RepID=UPI000B981966|nr:hypothetical protein [Petroclostridium xylanilyticum]